MIHLVYPMEIQVAAGCEVQPGNDPPHFHVAYQGSPLLSFQGNSWVPAPEAPFGINVVIQVLNQDRGTKEMLQELLNNTCPQLVRGLLQAGKTDLEKQGQPAFLSPALRCLRACPGFSTQASSSFEHQRKREALEEIEKPKL